MPEPTDESLQYVCNDCNVLFTRNQQLYIGRRCGREMHPRCSVSGAQPQLLLKQEEPGAKLGQLEPARGCD